MMMPRTLRAISLHGGIFTLGEHFIVRGIFPHAWNLLSARGLILTVTAGPHDGPCAVRVSPASLQGLHIEPDMKVHLSDAHLIVGPITISLRDAARWTTCLPDAVVQFDSLRHDVRVMAMCLKNGDGRFPSSERTNWNMIGLTATKYREDQFCRALVDLDAQGIQANVHSLIGLGPGLTPAGDDLLVGLIACIRIVGERVPERATWAVQLSHQLSVCVRDTVHRTTALSRTLLLAATQGLATQPLLEVLYTVGRGIPSATVQTLSAVGLTSGRAMLAGAILATLAIEERGSVRGTALVRPV